MDIWMDGRPRRVRVDTRGQLSNGNETSVRVYSRRVGVQ
jgi:hypothetical protein